MRKQKKMQKCWNYRNEERQKGCLALAFLLAFLLVILFHAQSALASGREQNDALLEAMLDNDVAMVDASLRAGADVNARYEYYGDEFTLVHLWLLVKGSDPNPESIRVIRRLVEAGIDVHAQVAGESGLEMARRKSSPDVVDILNEGVHSTARSTVRQPRQTTAVKSSALWGAIVVVDSDGQMSRGTAWDWQTAEMALKAAHEACNKKRGYCDLDNERRVIQVVFSTSAQENWTTQWGPAIIADHTEYPKGRPLVIRERCVVFYDEEDGPPSVAFGATKEEAQALWERGFSRSSFYAYGHNGSVQPYCNTR